LVAATEAELNRELSQTGDTKSKDATPGGPAQSKKNDVSHGNNP